MTEVVEKRNWQPIQMREERVVMLEGQWPKYAKLSMDLLIGRKYVTITENGHFKFEFHNATAIYKLDTVQDDRTALCLVFHA